MNEDQRTRLAAARDLLLDVLIEEMDPLNWSGAGKTLAKMTKDQRGGRLFDKKNVQATAMLVLDAEKLLAGAPAGGGGGGDDDKRKADMTKEAEKAADDLLAAVKKKAGTAAK